MYLRTFYAQTALRRPTPTSVGAAGLVALRVSLHPQPELVVPVPARPLGLRPQDPPAVAVRPAAGGGLLQEGDAVAHEAGEEGAEQELQTHRPPHGGGAAQGRRR